MNDLLEQFLIESRELVEQATDDLLALEQSGADGSGRRARLDSAFRAFHTLKGAAGIVEFAAMSRAMHAAEDILAAAKAGGLPITAGVIGDCLTCLDQIVRWLETMQDTGALPVDADPPADRLVARLHAHRGPLPDAAPAQTGSEARPSWIEPLLALSGAEKARTAIRYIPDADSFFRDEDPLALIAALPGLLQLDVQPRQPWPSLETFDPLACNLIIDALSSAPAAAAADHLRAVHDQVLIEIVPEHPGGGGERLPERAAAVLQAQIALLSEPVSDGLAGRLGSAAHVIRNVLRHTGGPARAQAMDGRLSDSLAASDPGMLIALLRSLIDEPGPAAPSTAQGSTPDGSAADGPAADEPEVAPTGAAADNVARLLRVDVERIDTVVKLAGELTVIKNAIGHVARLAGSGGEPVGLASALKDQHARLDRLTAELLQSVLAIRVLPLGHVFRRFPRLVREMAISLGKTARLVIDGEATEADKGVVEGLFEPLLHVLRNAVDHGVETTERRISLGKPETATIRLSGCRQGEHIIIEVADDGAGIDPGEIRRAAAQRGLASGDALAGMPDEEVVNLIFAPGFSTAATVSEISGRGVGMDAVRARVEQLGGRVMVRSEPDRGTTVRLTLPFTILMTRLMTVEAAGQMFGIPLDAVVETVQLPREQTVRLGAAKAFVLRGRTVPLIDLGGALRLDCRPRDTATAIIVLVEVHGQLGGLEVDRVSERLDVMLKPLDGLLAGMAGVAGTTLLGDGRVLIVLDLEELLE